MPIIEPFVRWAGGKSWFIPHLTQLINGIDINHFHEPFLGGAAVFLALEHKKKSYLSDVNEDLINAYIQIRDNAQQVMTVLLSYSNTKEDYYRIRSLNLDDPIEQAAKFIYLNQTMSYDQHNPNDTQQIDVFAADDESIIFVECKSSDSATPKVADFKKLIEALHGQMEGLAKEARSRFPGRKIKFIWATHNYIWLCHNKWLIFDEK